MKKTLFYMIILFTAGIFACKDMDSTYREYVIPDGITYPQKVSSLKFYPGLNRARLTWSKPVDPRVVKAKIYWNNYTDSVKFDIPRNSDTVSCIVEGLPEGVYTFDVVTCDTDNNVSVPVEVSGSVFGTIYISSLSGRGIASDPYILGSNGIVNWGGTSEDLVFSEIRYKTNSSGTQTVRVPFDKDAAICPDVKRNEQFEYRSAFLPPESIDTIYTEWVTFEIPFPLYIKYEKSGWVADGSDYLPDWWTGAGQGGEGGHFRQTIDGDITSAWHSNVYAGLPHWIRIDMGASNEIHHADLYLFWYYSYWFAKTVQIFTADSPDEADWHLSVEFTFPTDAANTSVNFPANTKARYLIIRFPDSRLEPYSNFAEIDVYGL